MALDWDWTECMWMAGDLDAAVRADLLAWRSERTPDRLAVIDVDTGNRWTYAAWNAVVDDLALTLQEAGVESGDRVASLLDTRPVAAALPFATIRIGATLAPLNVQLDDESLTTQLDRLDPAVLVCESDTESIASDLFDGEIRSVDASSVPGVTTVDPSLDVSGGHETPAVPRDESVGVDATALVVFTSGTTGQPKGVRLTIQNLVSSAVASAYRLGVTPEDRWLSPLSTYHVGGIAPFVRATLSGTAVAFQREFDAERTADALSTNAITGVSLVPTMLSRLFDVDWRPDPALRFVLLGGGPAPEALLERCLDHDVPVCPTYGTTETSSQIATATPGDVRSSPGTVGRPLVGTEVSIQTDGEGSEPGTVGELVVAGPTVAPGYLDDAATAAAFGDGRFRTGDRGYYDEDGRLWIVGRADDVIVTGGENVQPAVVVDALVAHPSVDDAAVVGVPDEEWGERVVALVVLEEGGTDTANPISEELRSFCRDRLPRFAIPKAIEGTEELPRTPSGTVDRSAVRDHFR